MNRRLFCLYILSSLSAGALGAAPPTLTKDEVEVSYENGMYTGRFSFFVPVPQAVAWEVLIDFDRMAAFVPNLESSRILTRDDTAIVFAQKGKISYGIFTFAFESERRVELHPKEGLLLAKALSGSAKHMASEMRVAAEGAGTRLAYRVEMIPGRWYPSSFGISGMRHEIAEQFTALAGEMLRRAESRAGR